MADPVRLYYATCRKNAKLTQEEAIVKLNIADSAMLSRIENGHNVPDQALVARMVVAYGVPSLAQWHVQHTNPDLAPWLPEVTILHTDGDVYLQAEQSTRNACNQFRRLRKALEEDEGIADNPKMPEIRDGFRQVASKSMSIVAYIDDNVKPAKEGA